MAKGMVYLVGAGPGDIGLITVKGRRCLEEADVVVYDFHLNAQVLNYINHEAEFIYAGKRGGQHSRTQDEINEIIVTKALEGHIVCRLKGGDPFVFGRGGEEAEALAEAGVRFEVVPGISSAIAAPAYAGIPLTHRKYSSSFAVVPGYEDTTKGESAIDWSKLATGVGTLVFLMAIKNIEELTKKLMLNGRPAETPVAIVRWGTRADQTTLTGELGNIAAMVRERDIRPPAVMVVGEVVRLRDKLKWFEDKPLFGVRVLVTREHAEGFSSLEALGAEVIEFPTIAVVPPEDWGPLDEAIEGIAGGGRVPDWLIFTSANGVKFFFERYFKLGHDVRSLAGIKLCAIGQVTAARLGALGLRVELTPQKSRAEGLLEALKGLEGRDNLEGLRFLLPRAEKAREVLPEGIRALGGEIDVPVAYRNVVPETQGKRLRRFLREGRISVVTFTSASTFDNFLKILGSEAFEMLKDVRIAVIGPVTARAVQAAGLKPAIMPATATVSAMAQAVEKSFTSHKGS